MFNFFSKNTASNNIPTELVNKVVNNSTTYAGVKVYNGTQKLDKKIEKSRYNIS